MKRGDVLADNFLEILLAVIGLLAVGYFAYQIYQVSVNQETTIAQRMLDSLETKINRLEIGEAGEFTMKTPCKDSNKCSWFLAAWGKEDVNRPEKCYFKSCVCACNDPAHRETLPVKTNPVFFDGVVRTCSSDNPGVTFDSSLFVDVGYCDQPSLRCWLDTRGAQRPPSSDPITTRLDCISGTSNFGVTFEYPVQELSTICQINGHCRFFSEERVTLISNYLVGSSIPNPHYQLGTSSGSQGPLISGQIQGSGIKLQPLSLFKITRDANGLTIQEG